MRLHSPSKIDSSHSSSSRPMDEYPEDSIQKIAVLFTDIVGSTNFFKSHGDLAGRQMLQVHQDIASGCITEHGGVLVKILGDSVMAYFLNTKETLKSAIKIQQKLKIHNRKRDLQDQIHIKIGIHFGDGIIETNDIFGNVVNIAAKLTSLVDRDQIYISQEVYELADDLSEVRFELVDLSGKKDIPRGLTAYRVIWEEAVRFDPVVKTLLYFKPIWNIANDDFARIWNRLLAEKDNFWSGEIEKESTLSDRSVALIVNEVPSALAIAKNVMAFIGKNLWHDTDPSILPIQTIIDSGPYLRADRIVTEGLEVNWEEIDPGEIYVSASARKLIKNEGLFCVISESDTNRPRSFYKLILQEDREKSGPYLFFYQNALTQGNNPPCYYCGDKKHLTTNCPTKHLPQTTRALEKLGYLSFDTINRLFLNYIAGTRPNAEPGEEPKIDTDGSTPLAYNGFCELKRIFQLRFFTNIWDATDETWNNIKKTSTEEDKGGFLWIALDCLRVSNLAQAEAFLESSLAKYPKDYRPYCAMGFLNVEKNDFLGAEYYFDKALEYAKTKPQRIFLLLLLSRLYDVNDRPFKAGEKIREIFFINSHCEDARYQDIIFKFREEKNSDALSRLIKLIQQDREFYVNALIDPDLAPFSKIIHAELKDLFEQAKDGAMQIFNKAKNELNKLEDLVGEKEIKEAQSLWLKIRELPKADSYFAYLDIIHYGGSILAIGRGSIEKRRGNLLEVLYVLNSRVEKYLTFVSNYPYQNLIDALYQQLRLLQTKIDQTRDMARSDVPGEFKEALARPEELSAELDQIESKLKRLETIHLVILFFTRFLKKALIFQSAVVFFAIIVFPITIYYLNLVLQKHGMSSILNIWSYQKGIIVFGAIPALLLAILKTIKSLHKK
ncbi:MAG: adenylate/guanylate cyclase domain-containing protein [Deltaproteobacteria bacterium]|nr:adenylate/guanylate cyclase domain-containing protein [Deltaproteobacteria bacterium]MBW1793959.1 adenylate/guanylate cyclase domain-containing protein [Deltaproteobacteria bacterium]MBW2329725.1 adenylate/guanylate cyclase domain-containing protein [Deltaproteobacteria bacterium]